MSTPRATERPHIRPATVADTGTILHFIRELAIYEKAEHEALAHRRTFTTACLARSPAFSA